MSFVDDMLNALSGTQGGTHPWLIQAVRGIAGDDQGAGPGIAWVLQRLEAAGYGAAVRAWTHGLKTPDVAPHDLHAALGDAQVQAMAHRANLTPDELVGKLSQHLPGIVAHLSTDGRFPG
ncbi:protein of unknown function [Rhodovastum atsumiense]|nr:YidB family protein [Rhodovastum atsumiense]CAH2598588.1 protein of unknown function [Rhodovastum atsumiense]